MDMKRQRIFGLLLVAFTMPQAGLSQGMVEQGGIYSGVAGLGAGLAAGGRTHADTLKHSFEAVGRAQQAVQQSVQEQSANIERNMKLGCQYEAAKQWENAENAFRWVLHGVAKRDGPGSVASVPALKHLVTISEAQHKLDDAIGFQRTVVAFNKVNRAVDYSAFASDQIRLINLYLEKGDYATAEPMLQEVVENPNPSLPDKERCTALQSYFEVLHHLNKHPYIEQPLSQMAQSVPQNDAASAETAKTEATQLLDYVNNTILSKRTALLNLPPTAVIQTQDVPAYKGASQASGDIPSKVEQP
jgi:tetratricopeptide (TPR) repeat protein